MSVGINHYRPLICNSIHAERNAINKLPNNKLKKIIKINIIVIRVSSTGIIGMSKPCSKCVRDMSIFPNKKGYTIDKIYYSDENGNIIKTTLHKLIFL